MSWSTKLRRGEGPFWGTLKGCAKAVLSAHVPVNTLTKPLFRGLYGLHVGGRESLAWAARFFWYEPLFRGQCQRVGPGFRMEQLPYINGHGRIELGADVRLSGKPSFTFSSVLTLSPEVVIGDGTFVGHGVGFSAARSIRVGSRCLLATQVLIYDYDGHPLDARKRAAGEPFTTDDCAPVTIGDDVWVGNGALVLKGVTIGHRSVIAARSVVTRDVPPDVIVAGNPAKIVREIIPP